MRIGELSEHSGLTRDTIRWYEKIGLITGKDIRRNVNNYRNYDASALERLMFIRQGKSFGFTLREIRSLLSMVEADKLHCDSFTPSIDSKLKAIDDQIASLQQTRNKLTHMKEQCTGDCKAEILKEASSNT